MTKTLTEQIADIREQEHRRMYGGDNTKSRQEMEAYFNEGFRPYPCTREMKPGETVRWDRNNNYLLDYVPISELFRDLRSFRKTNPEEQWGGFMRLTCAFEVLSEEYPLEAVIRYFKGKGVRLNEIYMMVEYLLVACSDREEEEEDWLDFYTAIGL